LVREHLDRQARRRLRRAQRLSGADQQRLPHPLDKSSFPQYGRQFRRERIDEGNARMPLMRGEKIYQPPDVLRRTHWCAGDRVVLLDLHACLVEEDGERGMGERHMIRARDLTEIRLQAPSQVHVGYRLPWGITHTSSALGEHHIMEYPQRLKGFLQGYGANPTLS
jgi:hypothetical protein